MDRDRDWLMLGYLIAELIEVGAVLVTLGVGLPRRPPLWMLGAAVALFAVTVISRRRMVHRAGGRWWLPATSCTRPRGPRRSARR
jgi:hypothetical protein